MAARPGSGIDLKLARDLNTVLTAVAGAAIAYTRSFDAPILVLEDLDFGSQSLVEAVMERVGESAYLLPAIQHRLTKLADESGIQVAFVSSKFTTRESHVCGYHSNLSSGKIYCQHEACPVESACRDQSAAATIANRLKR